MSKYLVLGFKNAGLFNDNRKSRDKSFDIIKGNEDRKNIGTLVEPITKHQVSNMLHVLFGERPVPMNRFSTQNKIDKYELMASSSYLKINTYKKPNPYNNMDVYPKQKIRLKKALYNAHSTPIITWEITKGYLGDTLFNEFINTIKKIYGVSPETHTFVDAMDIVRTDTTKINDLLEIIKKNKRGGLVEYIQDKSVCVITNIDCVKHTFASGIDNITKLDGTLYVPVDELDLEKLKNCVGTPTLLDGGLVYIKYITDGNNLSSEDFVKISDISNEVNELSYIKR